MISPDFQRADRLQQAFFQGPADSHHFPGRFHLGIKTVFGMNEFIKRKPRDFTGDIINGRFKRRRCIGNHDFRQ
ncbi:hypothetical protein SDC9_137979 [bioreactor metagenome]|uniref:Uncharacterized protein n=1 Tax=bioreactor metagenome TaxID=1076179 RepID=A0A645DNH8_9ZZZZ